MKNKKDEAVKIATINLYLAPNSNEPSSSQQQPVKSGQPREFKVTITSGAMEINQKDPRTHFQTILAHELGHVVAIVSKDPTHNGGLMELAALYQMMTGDAIGQIPAEEKAWEIARKINPNLDEQEAAECLASYTKPIQRQSRSEMDGDSWWSNAPACRLPQQELDALADAYQSMEHVTEETLSPEARLFISNLLAEDSRASIHHDSVPEPESVPLKTSGLTGAEREEAELAWLKSHGKCSKRERAKRVAKHPLSRLTMFTIALLVGVSLMELLDHSKAMRLMGLPIGTTMYHGVTVLIDCVCDRLFPQV